MHACMVMLHTLWVQGDAREKAVRKKFTLPKFGAVAKHPTRLEIWHERSGFRSKVAAPVVPPGQLAQQTHEAQKAAAAAARVFSS